MTKQEVRIIVKLTNKEWKRLEKISRKDWDRAVELLLAYT